METQFPRDGRVEWIGGASQRGGDMVAGQRRGRDYEGMWAGFHAAGSDRLAESSIPFAVSPGNHGYFVYLWLLGELARVGDRKALSISSLSTNIHCCTKVRD